MRKKKDEIVYDGFDYLDWLKNETIEEHFERVDKEFYKEYGRHMTKLDINIDDFNSREEMVHYIAQKIINKD